MAAHCSTCSFPPLLRPWLEHRHVSQLWRQRPSQRVVADRQHRESVGSGGCISHWGWCVVLEHLQCAVAPLYCCRLRRCCAASCRVRYIRWCCSSIRRCRRCSSIRGRRRCCRVCRCRRCSSIRRRRRCCRVRWCGCCCCCVDGCDSTSCTVRRCCWGCRGFCGCCCCCCWCGSGRGSSCIRGCRHSVCCCRCCCRGGCCCGCGCRVGGRGGCSSRLTAAPFNRVSQWPSGFTGRAMNLLPCGMTCTAHKCIRRCYCPTGARPDGSPTCCWRCCTCCWGSSCGGSRRWHQPLQQLALAQPLGRRCNGRDG